MKRWRITFVCKNRLLSVKFRGRDQEAAFLHFWGCFTFTPREYVTIKGIEPVKEPEPICEAA